MLSKFNAGFDQEMPLIKATIALPEKSIALSGGLESASLIRFNVKTLSNKEESKASPDDVDISVTLSEDGRVLKVTFDWRPEMIDETYQKIDSLKDLLTSETLLQMGGVKAKTDVLEKIARLTLDETAENLKGLMTLEADQYLQKLDDLKANMETVYFYNAEIIRVTVNFVHEWLNFGVKEM